MVREICLVGEISKGLVAEKDPSPFPMFPTELRERVESNFSGGYICRRHGSTGIITLGDSPAGHFFVLYLAQTSFFRYVIIVHLEMYAASVLL